MELNKNTIGQLFFTISILMLMYMLINPLTQVIANINEFFTLTLINFPISDILHILGGETNPPLYFLLVKGLSKLANDFAILKVFSIIPYAIVLILSTFKLRKDYGWLTAGLFALAIAAMSEFFITYSILRPYSWAMLFTLLSFIFFMDIITTANKTSFILFTLFSVLASYTHYYGLITAVVLYIILLFHILTHNKDKIKYLAISMIAGIVLYAPWIPTLVKLLQSMNPLGDLTTDSIIQYFAHFAYSGDTLFSIITLIILAIVLLIYLKEKDEDRTLVLYGIAAYFATVLVIILISIIIKPIMVTKGLVVASAILWLAISIMVGKMQNKRMLLISLSFVVLLLISGIGSMVVANGDAYQNGLAHTEALDQIIEDNNSTIIITNPGLAMYLLDFADQSDIYCINQDYIYGENMNRIHEIFNFKNIDKDEIANFSTNNSNKNIYLVSWGNPDVNVEIEPVFKGDMTISKVNTTNLVNEDDEYYY
ncbi:MAG: hypothetical protein IKH29_10145 [Methanobrevibacter sp.]|uniref:glycosyltransferase family 39 protein n=1 Tax=Methanobrevibacter sp. TaxID=66852 RepID=UPI0025CEA3EC|nr:hypothetical protein [Methanobrevibacter sp.]MBR3114045.1 hypothetical protein [Methanobrevibacter sp.]